MSRFLAIPREKIKSPDTSDLEDQATDTPITDGQSFCFSELLDSEWVRILMPLKACFVDWPMTVKYVEAKIPTLA
ncbi:hypothetical protein TNCV_222271 [Trichonephila clavipes]|nr:hypothetical protein TNCV_222271 [Trichonephila clavipes]